MKILQILCVTLLCCCMLRAGRKLPLTERGKLHIVNNHFDVVEMILSQYLNELDEAKSRRSENIALCGFKAIELFCNEWVSEQAFLPELGNNNVLLTREYIRDHKELGSKNIGLIAACDRIRNINETLNLARQRVVNQRFMRRQLMQELKARLDWLSRCEGSDTENEASHNLGDFVEPDSNDSVLRSNETEVPVVAVDLIDDLVNNNASLYRTYPSDEHGNALLQQNMRIQAAMQSDEYDGGPEDN
jgi:hypothetical protein